MNRALLVIAGLIVLLQVGLLGYGWTRAEDTDHVRTPIQPSTQLVMPLDLEGIAPFAGDVASDWRVDSQLVGASMQIDWPHERSAGAAMDLPQGGWVFLAFLSQDDLLTMRIDRASGTIVQTSVLSLDERSRQSYAGRVIDLSTAKTTSGTAALAAEAAYGRSFRDACPDQRFTSWLSIEPMAGTSAQTWHIEYKAIADAPQPPMTMDIDWQSGQIQNVTNATEPCA